MNVVRVVFRRKQILKLEHGELIYYVRGRGTIIQVDNKNYPKHTFKLDDLVLFQQETYIVYGIERVAYLLAPLQYSTNIGLQVKKYDKEGENK